MAFESTTRELLEGINSEIKSLRYKDYAKEVRNIKTFQIGVLPVTLMYPAVATLPNKETYGNFRTGGGYDIMRTIRIEGFAKDINVTKAQQQATKIGEDIREGLLRSLHIIKNDASNKQITFASDIGNVVLAEPAAGEDFVIGKFVLMADFYSKDALPSSRKQTALVSGKDQEEIFKQIVSIANSNKRIHYSKVNKIYDTSLPVIMHSAMPSIFIEEEQSESEDFEASRDTITRRYRFSVFTKALSKVSMLWDNIEVIEGLRKMLYENYNINGYVKNSKIVDVSYQISIPTSSSMPLYNTSMLFEAECYRNVIFNS